MKPITLLLVLLSGLLLCGCVNLKPQTDPVTLYTLGLNSASDSMADSTQPTFYIARPELPGYLHGSAMFYRTETGEKISLSKARWGEDLSEGIARALGEYLQSTGEIYVRSQYPWPKLSRGNPDIRVLFKRFGGTEAGAIEVEAIWQLRHNGETTHEGYFQSLDLSWDRGSPETYVAQLNKALQLLAQEIVDSI